MSKALSNTKQSFATQVVHAGHTPKQQGGAIAQSPVFASTFHLAGDVCPNSYQYGRFNNPSWQALEKTLGELELGSALIFPSGMAAIACVLTALVESGDTILLANDGYQPTIAYAETYLKKFGVNIKTAKTVELLSQDFSGIKLVFIENPSNPMLDVVDIKVLAERVHAGNGLLAVDNTTLTPLGQQPLLLGADISVCSDTKALNGHSDVVFGHVATTDSELFESMALWRKLAGNIPGPMETFLVQRGLASLDMRLARMTENAMVIAEFLNAHEKVKAIRYPGLPSDPSHQLAKTQMYHFGFIISFDLGEQQKAETFLANTKLIIEATSFGGMHTFAERRKRWGVDDVSPGVIRLSVGCEQVEDIIQDIAQALEVK